MISLLSRKRKGKRNELRISRVPKARCQALKGCEFTPAMAGLVKSGKREILSPFDAAHLDSARYRQDLRQRHEDRKGATFGRLGEVGRWDLNYDKRE